MKNRLRQYRPRRGELVFNHSPRLAVPIRMVGLICATVLFMSVSGCGGGKDSDVPREDVLLVAGESVLTEKDVVSNIPVGLEPGDSLELFHNIVDSWVRTKVLSELAESKLPDVGEIDRQVEAYRNRLIVAEYLRRMSEGQQLNVSEDSIKDFYSKHKRELLTETPLVKGVFVKLSSGLPGIDEIRNLIFEGNDGSIDRFEKTWLDDAIQYDYFGNSWVDWRTVADQIPFRFHDPDSFLAGQSNFETEYGGSVYFLHINDYIPSGSVPPLEFVAPMISGILRKAKLAGFEDALVKSLVRKALRDGRLVAEGYDPISRKKIIKQQQK